MSPRIKNTINKTAKRKYMSHIPSDELVTAPKELTSVAFQLLMYYYSKGDTWSWDDNNMSIDLGISPRTIVKYRKELVDKHYLLIIKGTVTNVFIGKQAVLDWLGLDS